MATFTRSDDLQGAEFVDANLRGARFRRADLSGVVMRAVDVRGADIDAPWLFDGESFLRVNGVDVIPLVEAELNRRFPGRADRRATDPDGLRAAWAALDRTWAATLERVTAMQALSRAHPAYWTWNRPMPASRTHSAPACPASAPSPA
jgi:uncharacterized protein YjbI with pentapeptide repeats